MPAFRKVNRLSERKRLLVFQADLHRQLLGLERNQLFQGVGEARDRLYANRWWLIGGTVAVGWLFTRRLPAFARWLPALMPAWRLVRGYLAQPSSEPRDRMFNGPAA